MATTRTPTQTWVARNGTFYIASGVGVSTSETLSGVFSASTTSYRVESACKNITITPPETSWEKQDLLGQDANDFQNQFLDEKPIGLATFTATLILGEDETIEDFTASGTVATASGYTRRQIGKNSTNVVNLCVSLETTGNANRVTFAMFNARVTKYGDVRIAGPDGHWEQDITAICLAKDFYYEFKD